MNQKNVAKMLQLLETTDAEIVCGLARRLSLSTVGWLAKYMGIEVSEAYALTHPLSELGRDDLTDVSQVPHAVAVECIKILLRTGKVDWRLAIKGNPHD